MDSAYSHSEEAQDIEAVIVTLVVDRPAEVEELEGALLSWWEKLNNPEIEELVTGKRPEGKTGFKFLQKTTSSLRS